MPTFWKEHVFTAELPYEKDQVITLFLRDRFVRVDSFIMSLGQMSNIPPSRLYSYLNGKLIGKRIFTRNKLEAAGVKLYFFWIPRALIHVTLDLLRALKTINFTCDIFFAQHFLPAYLAIILRRMRILHGSRIVFFMFDFFLIPPEFPRNLYYRAMDMMHRYIRKHVDEIWFTTPRLAECDKERFGSLSCGVTKRITQGCFFRRIQTSEPPPIPPLCLAFVGSLRPNNAVYESIDSIWCCLQHGMEVELMVVGSGPKEASLKAYVNKKGLRGAVKFCGFEDRGEEIAKILSTCHLGLALYNSNPYSPNWFLTSGKFRRFISQRLPVIISPVPYAAKYIHDYQAGLIVDNNPEDVWQALRRIYENPSLLESLRRGVDKLYTAFKADKVLSEAFSAMLDRASTRGKDDDE